MLAQVRNIVRKTDAATAGAYLSLFHERGGLVSLLFHSLFIDEAEIARNLIHPTQHTTVAHFRRVLSYYREQGYRFIRPSALQGKLDPHGKYALISFDDGYFNNTRALPILEEFDAPAAFFIATDNVLRGKSYWWDVHWRESAAAGMSDESMVRDGRKLKSMTTEQIEEELTRRFGAAAFGPRGDLDRPFTPHELRTFSRHSLVELGNHTSNHAILINYSPAAAREQIARAQKSIEWISGSRPTAIAYPNGAHSAEVIAWCVETGLQLGFTVRPRKTAVRMTAGSPAAMHIGRFMPDGREAIEKQCKTYRSDLQLYAAFHAGYERLAQRRGKHAMQSQGSA
jgi:peptidoglycan/xylan/chitin deacetylase (PgdA/CDA1 family)